MNEQNWSTDKLIETWLIALEEPISDELRAELNRQLAEQPHLRERLIHLAQEQSWLMWHGAAEDEPETEAPAPAPVCMEPLPTNPLAAEPSWLSRFFPGSFSMHFLGVAAGFLIGATVAAFVVRNLFLQSESGPITQGQLAASTDHDSPSMGYAATLVNVTNCRWEPHGNGSEVPSSGAVRPGQVLRLMEGIAEIQSARPDGGSARFVLEGPLSMVMTGDGTPTLQHGKLFAAIDPKYDLYELDTPLGLVTIDDSAAMGVVASGNDVTIHVFAGSVTFELPGAAESIEDDQFKITAGRSLRLTTGTDNMLRVQRGNSNERNFVASVPMAEDRLTIAEEYVAAVLKSKPIGYWRFESDAGQCVRNEMSSQFHFRLRGEVGWRDYPGNRAIELGSAQKPGYLLTDDNLGDAIRTAYSVEAWVKPSHFHSGALFGMVDWPEEAPVAARHGVLLDLCGPTKWQQMPPKNRSPVHPGFHPKQVRFLQRVPLSADANLGTSCYSVEPYECRRWQYLVGIKDGNSLKLFVDGELISEEKDENQCPAGLRALIGQAWPTGIVGTRPLRQFVGELDEVALYDRALEANEIREHFRLGHVSPLANNTSN